MEAWKTLVAPIIVALIVGYVLKDIQQPPAAAIAAQLNWIDTPNPMVAMDIRKALESASPDPQEKAAIEQLIDTAGQYLHVRIATIKVSNTSNVIAKASEVSLPKGGVLYWYEDKKARIATKKSFEGLLPGAELELTAIVRPTIVETETGILITHNGQKIGPAILRAPSDMEWLVSIMADYPAAAWPITIAAFGLSAVFLIAFGFASYMASSFERRATWTSPHDAKELAKFVASLRKSNPEKFK